MNDVNKDEKEELKAILQVGLTAQSISAIVVYAIKNEKKDFLQELNTLLEKFMSSLSEEEKSDLKKDLDTMMENKVDEFMANLDSNLNEDEMAEALSFLKNLT